MAFVWDLIQQIQLHNTQSRAKSARAAAQSAELRARVAESRSRTAESRVRELEARVDDLEGEVSEMRTTLAVLARPAGTPFRGARPEPHRPRIADSG